MAKNTRSSEDALSKLRRWRNFHIPLKWIIGPTSPSEIAGEFNAQIDLFDEERNRVRIWVSNSFMRTFSLDSCSKISVCENGLDITKDNGTRYILTEERPV
jgi:hypothetical protein